MDIFINEQHGSLSAQAANMPCQDFQGLFLLLFRGHFQRWIAPFNGNTQQRCNQRNPGIRSRTAALQQRFKLAEPRTVRIPVIELRSAFQLLDDRV